MPVEGAAAPSHVPLTGADCFLRAFDHELRRKAGASHVSQLYLRLGPGFDVEALRRAVTAAAEAHPIVRAPVGRRFGVGNPHYRVAAGRRGAIPEVTLHTGRGRAAGTPEIFFERLNTPLALRRGELLRFDIVEHPGGKGFDFAASWAHMLLDGSGSERFIRYLEECGRGERTANELFEPDEFAPPEAHSLGARERGERAVAWQKWMEAMAEHPLRSPAGPIQRGQQALRYAPLTLDEDESVRAAERAKERAGFMTPMLFYLAAAIRAHHAVFQARGVDPGSYVVPLPVDLRPKGRPGATFRTHTSLLWFQVLPKQVDDLETLLAELKKQRHAAIKSGQVDNARYAMEFARMAPRRLYAHMARKAHRGELCSFFFAYTGEFLEGVDSFFGAEIENGYHVAPVPPSPGSCIAMSHIGGRLNANHVFQRGVFDERELETFRHQLHRDLAG